MKTKQPLFCGLIAVVSVLIFTTCLSIAGGTRAHTHQWSEWTQVSGDDATEERVCKIDSAHIQTRLTGTGRFYFQAIDETAYRVRAGTLTTGEITIPAYYRPDADSEYLPVIEIGSNSDTYSSDIYSNGAFSGIDITFLNISEGVTSIGNYAFCDCFSLTSVTIPVGVKSIGDSAFYRCFELYSITISTGLRSIGNDAFSQCRNLTRITIPASVTSIGMSAFSAFIGSDNTITIPMNLSTLTFEAGSQLQSIGISAFRGCTNLTNVTIPAGVTYIGPDAFHDTAWFNSQPDGLVYAGKVLYTYKGTMSANTVINNIRADTTTITDSAFYWCENLAGITIPAGVTSIGREAFFNCENLTNIVLPARLTSIGNNAFYGCTGLTSITIPESVTSIGFEAFYRTAWFNSQPDGLVYAGKVLCTYKGTMPDNTVINDMRADTIAIADGVFVGYESLTGITLPTGLTFIGNYAFSGCTSLISITVPKTVLSIGESVFRRWTNQQTINIEGHASEASADRAWRAYWRYDCNAQINYLGH